MTVFKKIRVFEQFEWVLNGTVNLDLGCRTWSIEKRGNQMYVRKNRYTNVGRIEERCYASINLSLEGTLN